MLLQLNSWNELILITVELLVVERILLGGNGMLQNGYLPVVGLLSVDVADENPYFCRRGFVALVEL